jgi:hypothetical protein
MLRYLENKVRERVENFEYEFGGSGRRPREGLESRGGKRRGRALGGLAER